MDIVPDISTGMNHMIRPPVNRAMQVLDRSFFKKSVILPAARVKDRKQITKIRDELGPDVLKLLRIQSVQQIRGPDGEESKAVLLHPRIKTDDSSTWSPRLSKLVEASDINLTPYTLEIDYNYWKYHEIMSAILPEEDQHEYPKGFSIVGHVAHLNLREEFLRYKQLIAEVILDKNPTIRTVINKIDEVGDQNAYRTFSYELLAGEPNLDVEVHEQDSVYRFDYSKVYWNTRLENEHRRLVEKFRPGEVVCDVMAGVGPFAVPAAKKHVFVWANDLNPDSYDSLNEAVEANKVSKFVKTFNEDGHSFITTSAKKLLESDTRVDTTPKHRFSKNRTPMVKSVPQPLITSPKTFTHYILNLPASATTFLPAFISLYAGHSELFAPHTPTQLPMVHVYCFSTKSDSNKEEELKICREISGQIGFEMRPGDPGKEGEVGIWDVRDVAPLKRMFCASFRLPGEVVFRRVGE